MVPRQTQWLQRIGFLGVSGRCAGVWRHPKTRFLQSPPWPHSTSRRLSGGEAHTASHPETPGVPLWFGGGSAGVLRLTAQVHPGERSPGRFPRALDTYMGAVAGQIFLQGTARAVPVEKTRSGEACGKGAAARQA